MGGATTVIDIVAQVTDNTASGAGSAQRNVSNLEKSISKLYQQLSSLKGKSKLEVKATLKDLASKGITTIWNAGKKIAGKTWNIAVKLTDLATAPLKKIWDIAKNPVTQMITLTGVSIGAADTINTYKDFEQGMANVKAISGATDEEFAALTEQAKQLGESTRYSATEAAGAMENLAMAGWKSDSIISGMPGLLSLAAAGSVDLATAADVTASALAQFGYDADQSTRVADVLAATASNSKTDVQGLGESLKYAGPLAGALGYSIEDVALALGVMGNSSIDASTAGTALRGVLSRMAKQGELTEEESNAVSDAMKKVGVSMTDSQGRTKSLMEIMGDLRTGFSNLTEAEKTEVAANLAGQNAMSGLLAIVNTSDEDFNQLAEAINGAQGAAEEMANVKMDTLEGSIYYLQSAVEGVQIALGERITPYFRSIIDAVTAQMPTIQSALDKIMDGVDAKITSYQNIVKTMLNSEEWQNADFGGKINIAWDKLIATPFTKWFNQKGKKTMIGAISGIFSEAGKILPGGEEAGLSSWMSAGLIVKAADPVVKGVQSVTSALSAIHPLAGTVASSAAVIAGAIAAIGVAVENYNQKQISDNLEEHFGSIQLSAKEAQEAAAGILDIKYLANVELALGAFKNADQLHDQAEAALEANDELEWKAHVTGSFNGDEIEEYISNIGDFIDYSTGELENRSFGAHILVKTFFGESEEGQKLDEQILSWARADTLELDGLANDLRTAVDEALSDGIMTVDEEKHISELQEKINGITNRWKKAEAQAQLDWINQKYGNLSGKDLTSDSFTEVVNALGEQRELADAETQSAATAFFEFLNAAEGEGRLGPENGLLTAAEYKEMVGLAIRNQEAQNLMTSVDFETNTLKGTYGSRIKENRGNVQSAAEEAVQNAKSGLLLSDAGQMEGFIVPKIKKGDSEMGALNEIWQTMKPDANAMGDLIDRYANLGQEVPKQLMDKFNETMEIGAASGDTDAAWQVYANALAQSGDQALIDSINQLDKEGNLAPELSAAWKRSMAGVTDEPVTLEGLQTEIDGVEMKFDKSQWSEQLHQIEENLSEGDIGTITAETEADFTVTVNKGDCLSQIGEATGVDWQEIAEYNGIEDPYIIYPDMEIKIPKEGVTMDSSGVETSMEEAVSALSSQGTGLEVTTEGVTVTMGEVNVDPADTLAKIAAAVGTTVEALEGAGITEETITAGATVTIPQELITVETGGLNSAIESAMSGENADGGTVEGVANVEVEAGTVDPSGAYTDTQTETQGAFDNPFPTDGHTDVTLDQTNNAPAIYAETASDVRSTYSTPIPVTATVNVTLNWNLLNPHKSITVSGSGSGSGELNAAFSAEGRYVDGAMLSVVGEDGPEYIIPVSGKHRDRGLELWEQAGHDLGIPGFAEGGIIGQMESPDAQEQMQEMPEPVFEIREESSGQAAPAAGDASVTIENINFDVNIDGSGGQDPQALADAIRENVRGMTDDIAYQLAAALQQVYANTPKQAWGT